MLDLTGRCAVVTGGSRGIGQATAIALAAAGADVASLHLPEPDGAERTAVERQRVVACQWLVREGNEVLWAYSAFLAWKQTRPRRRDGGDRHHARAAR